MLKPEKTGWSPCYRHSTGGAERLDDLSSTWWLRYLSFYSFTVYSLEQGMALSGIMAPFAESYSGTKNSPKSYVIPSLESDSGSKTM